MKQQILSWWYGLKSREQQLLLAAGAVVLVAVCYWLIWQPVTQNVSRQQQALQQAQAQLLQLQQALPRLAATGNSISREGGSLTQIVSNSARSHGIRVSRIQPQGTQLQLVLEDSGFDALLAWLHQLQYQHGLILVNLDIATADKSGMVRVRRMVVE